MGKKDKQKYEEIRQHVKDVLDFHDVKDFILVVGDEKFCVAMGSFDEDSFLELYSQIIQNSISPSQKIYRQMKE